jgi:hypothetical protein
MSRDAYQVPRTEIISAKRAFVHHTQYTQRDNTRPSK